MQLLLTPALFADNLLHPAAPVLDRPTLTTLGVRVPLSGDDNFNSAVGVRYRVTGTNVWSIGLPLFRVHPETVANYTVAPQFGGSIFDLKPGTTYDIELHATDPDGLDQTFTLTGTTRKVPGDPATPAIRNVSTSAAFQSALDSASPGDIITLANGFYPGTFGYYGSGGTAANPIVIRGASEDGVILDGGNCTGCNEIEVYGAGYVHIENLTMQNVERAIRFQSNGATANVVRRIHAKNTSLGIGYRGTQYDFYIADNILEGQILWPHIYSDDNGQFADQDGIAVSGFGHVVAHNQISGYGDAMKTVLEGARANEFYGNEVLYTYDNAIELDASEGNTRAFRNRFTNTYSPVSLQPIHGGPAYVFRNVVVNFEDEPLKFHAEGSPYSEPSGILVYHNTFVAPSGPELKMETVVTSHYFAIENNLFIAPAPTPGDTIAVDWLGVNDHGVFDYNAYFPDGSFRFHNPPPAGYLDAANFAGLQGTGYETHGMIAQGALFSNGLTGPASYTLQLTPVDVSLAPGSIVQDKGFVLPNINDNYTGSGPDLGAAEVGCSIPIYGPRPQGIDESNEVLSCAAAAPVTAVSVSPITISLAPNAQQQFAATTTPSGGTVNWLLAPVRGTITAGGLYTAPADAVKGETITITASAANNPMITGSGTITFSATGAMPIASLNPAALTFGVQNTGTSAPVQNVTLTNNGAAPMNISSVYFSGANAADFGQTGTCGSTVAAGATCSISVTFTPSGAGSRSASLNVGDNAVGSPHSVSISGTGVVASTPKLTLGAQGVNFPATSVGTASTQTLAISNSGTAGVNGMALSVTGANAAEFAYATTCVATLAAGSNCSVSITFNPAAAGIRNATLTVAGNAIPNQQVALTGTGTSVAAPSLTLLSGNIFFGSSPVGTPAGVQSVTLANLTATPVSGIVLSIIGPNASDFGQHNSCGSGLAPYSYCYVWVNLTPSAPGVRAGTLSIVSGGVSPQNLAIVGTGIGSAPTASLAVYSGTIYFGSSPVGMPTGYQSATIGNTTSSNITGIAISLGGANPADFAEHTSCGSSLAPNSYCYVWVNLTPTALGSRAGSLNIVSSGALPQAVALVGSGR